MLLPFASVTLKSYCLSILLSNEKKIHILFPLAAPSNGILFGMKRNNDENQTNKQTKAESRTKQQQKMMNNTLRCRCHFDRPYRQSKSHFCFSPILLLSPVLCFALLYIQLNLNPLFFHSNILADRETERK